MQRIVPEGPCGDLGQPVRNEYTCTTIQVAEKHTSPIVLIPDGIFMEAISFKMAFRALKDLFSTRALLALFPPLEMNVLFCVVIILTRSGNRFGLNRMIWQ